VGTRVNYAYKSCFDFAMVFPHGEGFMTCLITSLGP